MDDVYVLNNPWAIQSVEKHTSYCAMMRLGMKVPDTWMLPPKTYPDNKDFQTTVKRYNRLFDLKSVGKDIGYPAFLKPYDGGGWVGVKQVKNHDELLKAYDASGERVQHLQAAVKDYDLFVRGIGIGPQVNLIRYDPSAPLHARYVVDFHFLEGEEWLRATKITRVINAFLDGISTHVKCSEVMVFYIQSTLQMLVLTLKSPLCTIIFRGWLSPNSNGACFAQPRIEKMRLMPIWQPYFDIAEKDLPFKEKLDGYDQLARTHFDTDRFGEFTEKHLSHVDEVAHEFFGSDAFKRIIHEKVSALYPSHEIERFTDHFGLVQFWRQTNTNRPALKQSPPKKGPKSPLKK